LKEVALVLGGGGARGLAHIHVLKAFDDLGVRPCVIAGSSIGSVIGAGYAAGMSADEISDYAVKTFSKRAEVMSRLWRMRPDGFGPTIFAGAGRVGEFSAQKVMRAFLPEAIPDRFEDLKIPLKVTATDFFASTLTVLERGDLFQAIAASSALPVLFRPEIIDGRVHVDGGFVNPVPFDLVIAPERIVVAVDVIGMPRGKDRNMPTRIEAAFGASQLLMHSITRLMLDKCKPDLLIRPEISEFRVLDFLHAERILKRTEATRADVRTGLERLLKRA
jgi:NTE family protein